MSAELDRWARTIIVPAFAKATGQDGTIFALQVCQAVARYESSYGRGWDTEEGNAAHNWGSVQCTKAQVAAGVPCFAHHDSFPDGTKYDTYFRVYDSDVDGAADMIKYIWRSAQTEILAATSTDDVWEAMFWGHYYGASCPNAIKQYGEPAVRSSNGFTGKPATTLAGRACEGECIKEGQDTGYANVQAIAAALNEPVAQRSAGLPWWLLLFGGGSAAVLGWKYRDKVKGWLNP